MNFFRLFFKPLIVRSFQFQKAFKESSSDGVKGLRKAGNVYLKTREVSRHEAIANVVSLSARLSNIDVIYIPSGMNGNNWS